MNSNKLLKMGFIATLAVVPFHAQAISGQAGMNACAEAMISELAAEQGSPVVYNMDPKSSKMKQPLMRREVIHLDARDPDSDKVVARVDCVLNSKAEVKELIQVPLDGPDARLRATQID